MLIGTAIKKCMFDGVQHLLLFYVSNGVKHSVILSPMLFNIYMNQLSIRLNRSGIGGDMGGHLINDLCYADDLCLISLSSAGIQSLLDICNTNSYAIEHVLTYNSSKSYSLCFKLIMLIHLPL